MAEWLRSHGVQLVVSPATCTCFRSRSSTASRRGRQRPPVAAAASFPARTRSRTSSPQASPRRARPCTSSTRASTPARSSRRSASPSCPTTRAETLHARIQAGRAPAAARGGEGAVRALISTYDKTGLDVFARGLDELGWELVASGGTAARLEAIGLAVEHVEDVTALAGDARRPREDAAPAHPRRHPRAPRRRRRRRDARGARDRAVRPRLRQPLSVRGGHGAAGRDARRRRSR